MYHASTQDVSGRILNVPCYHYYPSDMDRVEEVRTMVPLRNQRRHDLYKVLDLTNTPQNQGKQDGN